VRTDVLGVTNQDVVDATRLAAYASIAVAIATVLLAVFTWRLAKQAKRAAGDTEVALAVAQQQATAVMLQAETAQGAFSAAHLPNLGLAQEPVVDTRFDDERGNHIVRVAATVESRPWCRKDHTRRHVDW
jgi:hypothetical protein